MLLVALVVVAAMIFSVGMLVVVLVVVVAMMLSMGMIAAPFIYHYFLVRRCLVTVEKSSGSQSMSKSQSFYDLESVLVFLSLRNAQKFSLLESALDVVVCSDIPASVHQYYHPPFPPSLKISSVPCNTATARTLN